jgi:hypothetical protein
VGEIERGDRRLPDIGVDMAGQAAEPGVDRVDGLAIAVKSRPWMTFSTSRSFSSAMRGSRPTPSRSR